MNHYSHVDQYKLTIFIEPLLAWDSYYINFGIIGHWTAIEMNFIPTSVIDSEINTDLAKSRSHVYSHCRSTSDTICHWHCPFSGSSTLHEAPPLPHNIHHPMKTPSFLDENHHTADLQFHHSVVWAPGVRPPTPTKAAFGELQRL